MSAPLHTNSDKKPLFIFAVLMSSVLSFLLFSTIGGGILGVLWGAFGVAVVIFAAGQLRQSKNKKSIKKKLPHILVYIICTIVSFFGTIGTGYNHLEKTKNNNSEIITEIEIIDKKINYLENKKDYTDTAINNVIQKTNLNQWALINLLKKKSQNENNVNEKFKIINDLKLRRAVLVKDISGVLNSLTGVSKILNIADQKVAFIFLISAALLIEIMIFFTADFNGGIFKMPVKKKIKKTKKKKEIDQLFFLNRRA